MNTCSLLVRRDVRPLCITSSTKNMLNTVIGDLLWRHRTLLTGHDNRSGRFAVVWSSGGSERNKRRSTGTWTSFHWSLSSLQSPWRHFQTPQVCQCQVSAVTCLTQTISHALQPKISSKRHNVSCVDSCSLSVYSSSSCAPAGGGRGGHLLPTGIGKVWRRVRFSCKIT